MVNGSIQAYDIAAFSDEKVTGQNWGLTGNSDVDGDGAAVGPSSLGVVRPDLDLVVLVPHQVGQLVLQEVGVSGDPLCWAALWQRGVGDAVALQGAVVGAAGGRLQSDPEMGAYIGECTSKSSFRT